MMWLSLVWLGVACVVYMLSTVSMKAYEKNEAIDFEISRPEYKEEYAYEDELFIEIGETEVYVDVDVTAKSLLAWQPLLNGIREEYLVGLEKIIIINEEVICNKKKRCLDVQGVYSGVKEIILKENPKGGMERTLYHEIGHHVFDTQVSYIQKGHICKHYNQLLGKVDGAAFQGIFPSYYAMYSCSEYFAESFSYVVYYNNHRYVYDIDNKTIEVILQYV